MRSLFFLTLALLLAACASESMLSNYEMGPDEYGPVPQADPDRLVGVQDCTKPIAMGGGNLRCM
ncbi:MAG TPA: hypothetical protein VMI74_02205 [Burkholderiales bacterium]|nr:hypothetical protein [Burkholderiales bacterium]